MSVLKKLTSRQLKESIPLEDRQRLKRSTVFASPKEKPINGKKDAMIKIEIAFRGCKRVGVFD